MPAPLSDILKDPDYLALPPPEQAKVRQGYFDRAVAVDEDYKALPKAEQAKVRAVILGGGKKAPTRYPGGEGMLGGNIRSPLDPLAMGVMDAVKQGALPTAGGAIGAKVGGAFSPIGILPGEAIGSMAGEGLNQLLGVTEPSLTNLAIEGASGPLMRGTARALSPVWKGIAKKLPGAGAGLQEGAIGMARELPGKLAPGIPSDAMFEQVKRAGNPVIRVKNFKSSISELLSNEDEVFKALRGELEPLLKGLTDELSGVAGVRIGTFKAALERVGQRTGSVQGVQGNEIRGAYRKLTDALFKDLDEAVKAGGQTGKAATALKAARDAYRKDKAVEKLGEVIEGAVNKGGVADTFSPGKVMNQFKEVRRTKIFRESFSEAEQKEITDLMNMIRELPKPGAARGVDAGSRQVLGRLATGGSLAGVLSGAGFVDPMTATALTGGYYLTASLVAKAMGTKVGRGVLKSALRESKGILDHNVAARLGNFFAAQDQMREHIESFVGAGASRIRDWMAPRSGPDRPELTLRGISGR